MNPRTRTTRDRQSAVPHLPYLLVLPALALFAPVSSAAGAQTRLTDSLTYEIVATFEVALGTAEGGGMVESERVIPWRAPWGDYLLTGGGPAVQAFDSAGRLLARFERPGEGPGELAGSGRVVFRGDSVIAFDDRQPRFLVLDSSLGVRRTVSLPVAARFGALAVDDSLLVLPAHVADRTHLGNPYQIVDFEGRHHGSFGGSGVRYRDDRTAASIRLVTAATSRTFWTARLTAYAFQEMDLDGGVVRSFEHSPDFFPAENDGNRQPDRAPPPTLTDLQQDRSGRLWLTFVVADPRWQEAVDTTEGVHGGRITDYDLYYDSIVEVVDPSSGSVLARRRFDPVLLALLSSRSIGYISNENPAVPVVRIETLTLERREE